MRSLRFVNYRLLDEARESQLSSPLMNRFFSISSRAMGAALMVCLFGVTLWAQRPGELDRSFAPKLGVNPQVNAILVQSDGRILIGGSFVSFDGAGRRSIARLNLDGSFDPTFAPGSTADGAILSMA